MNSSISSSEEYYRWVNQIKTKVMNARVRVSIAANRELILFYWDLGETIVRKMKESSWGNKVIDMLAEDLARELPGIKGFSRRNLYYVKKFYLFFSKFQAEKEIVPQPGAQFVEKSCVLSESGSIPDIIDMISSCLPWGHIKIVIDKLSLYEEVMFYIKKTVDENWSRNTLALQIKSDLYRRQGKALTNFKDTLPPVQSDLAQQLIKDPYSFDFISLGTDFNEREIEDQLIAQITKFLLELGKGFAFIGRQYHMEIGDQSYYIDLLFYHITLRCYVVVELKNAKFKPEYAGKLNFYLSAVDTLLKSETDNPAIGIMLCRDKDRVVTEFALRGMNKPMSVGEFCFMEQLPDELKKSLPTVEDIERAKLV